MGRYAIIVVLTLFFLLVYFIISTNQTIGHSASLNINSFQTNNAKNIANSAAQIAVKKIIDGDWQATETATYLTSGVNNFENWTNLNGSYSVQAVKNNDIVSLTVTGKSGLNTYAEAATYEVVVTLKVEDGGNFPTLDAAVFSQSTIDLTGSSQIVGDAGTNSTAPNSVNFGWSTKVVGNFSVGPGADYNSVINSAGWGRTPEDNITGTIGNITEIREFPLPDYPNFPTGLPSRSNINIVGNSSDIINASGHYDTISILGNNNLYIATNGNNITIRVRDLNIGQGHIILQGEGRVTFYIEDGFTLNGSSTINNNGNPSKTFSFYSGTAALNPGGDTRYNGSIYVEQADIIVGGSNGILGHIISGGSNVTITGNAEANVRALYAPNAHVQLGGSGRVRGAVVSNSFTADGNTRVFFDDSFDLDDIPELGGGSSGSSIVITGWR